MLKLTLTLAILAAAAYGAMIDATYMGIADSTAPTVERTIGTTTTTLQAGLIAWRDNATGANFWTLCVEPGVAASSTQFAAAPLPRSAITSLLEQNVVTLAPGTLDALAAAALQVAIWEIVSETSGVFDLAAGTTTFNLDAPLRAKASSYIASVNVQQIARFDASPSRGGFVSLISPDAQDQISQTPEPASFFLVGAALVSVAWWRRRRL